MIEELPALKTSCRVAVSEYSFRIRGVHGSRLLIIRFLDESLLKLETAI